MTYELHRHDARHISDLLEPESVDLIVTSPPYFALRSYQDGCPTCAGAVKATMRGYMERYCPECGAVGTVNKCPKCDRTTLRTQATKDAAKAVSACPDCNGTGRSHYDGQLGSEPTPTEFLDNLIACTADWLRVLKPGGSLWVNLGDKYAGSGGHNNNGLGKSTLNCIKPGYVPPYHENNAASRRNAPDRYNQASDGIRAKSLMGLPWRYAIRCIDELGLILRAEVIWSKPNGLPESVTDRVRRSHEQWFHFTREGRYFAAIDEVREGHAPGTAARYAAGYNRTGRYDETGYSMTGVFNGEAQTPNPLGKAPGSVWSIPSEPLTVPDHLGVDHFAAFPSELVRRIVLGWTPVGFCVTCGEARRAVVDTAFREIHTQTNTRSGRMDMSDRFGGATENNGVHGRTRVVGENLSTITGYVCACPDTDAATTPAVVVDPFAGTGTTVAVAHLLGRHGVGTDLSNDYLRLADWRCTSDQRLRDKVLERSGIPNPDPPAIDGQLDLFGEAPPKPPHNPPIRWRDGAQKPPNA